jgi:hypothetical protein
VAGLALTGDHAPARRAGLAGIPAAITAARPAAAPQQAASQEARLQLQGPLQPCTPDAQQTLARRQRAIWRQRPGCMRARAPPHLPPPPPSDPAPVAACGIDLLAALQRRVLAVACGGAPALQSLLRCAQLAQRATPPAHHRCGR